MSGSIPPLPYMPSWCAFCVCACMCARVLRDEPYLDFNTFDSCLGPRDIFYNVYVIFTAELGKFLTVCSGNRVRAVIE